MVSSEEFGAAVCVPHTTRHTHVRGVQVFVTFFSDFPVSILALKHLVASATLADKAVVSSEEFGAVVCVSRSTRHAVTVAHGSERMHTIIVGDESAHAHDSTPVPWVQKRGQGIPEVQREGQGRGTDTQGFRVWLAEDVPRGAEGPEEGGVGEAGNFGVFGTV